MVNLTQSCKFYNFSILNLKYWLFEKPYNLFWSYSSPSPLLKFHQICPQLLNPPILCPLLFEFNLYYTFTSGGGAIHWGVVNLPGGISIKKTDSSSARSYQHHELFLPTLRWLDLGWVLLRYPQLIWDGEGCGPAMSRKHSFTQFLPNLYLLKVFLHLSPLHLSLIIDGPLTLGVGMLSGLWLNTPLSLFSAIWPTVGVSIKHCLLHKKFLRWGVRAALIYG